MSTPRILVMAGSSRNGSLARRLAAASVAPLEARGASVDLIELADYPMPLYNGDLEAESGLPEAAVSLQGRLYESQGLLVVSPEYNGSITPLLKNTLDWCSRPNPDDAERSGGKVYAGRAAAAMATSPGPMGGVRVLFHLRDILGYLGLHVIPQQLGVGMAGKAIGADGRLAEARQQDMFESTLNALVDTARRLA
ncbi:MAG: NAD(P)H-dependent oxidoreductase [Rhodocyclaceae bacterium]|nr:NAD(P)H-dependent oxidoreductase [Rhodocyclaceae bacterium]